MKHVRAISERRPRSANVVGDIVCHVNSALRDLLGFAGGTKPAKEFAADRCDLPGDTNTPEPTA